MKLNWIVSDIENKIKNVKLSHDEVSIKNQFIYGKMLSDLSYTSSTKKNHISREDFFERLNEFELSYFYNPFFNLINEIYKYISDYDYEFEYAEYEYMEPENVIKVCKDFYKQGDKDSFTMFKRILKSDNSIQYIDNRDLSFLGRTYYISQDEYYILINGRNYLENIIATIHECKHVDMYLRGYNKGLPIYNELAPIIYEMNMIDYLEKIDDIGNLKINNINKYIQLIRKIGFQINLIKDLKSTKHESDSFELIYNNYEQIYDEYRIEELYNVLNVGYSRSVIGKIISFIVGLDIYINGSQNNINNLITCYIFGIYKLEPSILDDVLEYINQIYKCYDKEKIKKKIEK